MPPPATVRLAALAAPPDRLGGAQTIGDLRALGRRKVPRAVFDFVDGAAESEIGLAEARAAWRDVRFHPRAFQGVASADASTTILGEAAAMPLVLAPIGHLGVVHREAEHGAAAAAAAAGVPFTVSTLGTTALRAVVQAHPGCRTWFQLYLTRDVSLDRALIQEAVDSGADTLVLTADSPVSGARLRDRRNGLTIPPAARRRTALIMTARPRWGLRVLRDPPRCANLEPFTTKAAAFGSEFAAPVGPAALEEVRALWPGRLVVKGLVRPEDAEHAVALGADAVVLSHHGGRQLDRVPPPLVHLPEVLDRIGGRAEVYVDSGITCGADVVAAVAAGATGCFVGRAYVFGLMAGGRRGVDRALTILRRDIERTMCLLGAATISDLAPDLVTLPKPAQMPRSTTVIPDPDGGPLIAASAAGASDSVITLPTSLRTSRVPDATSSSIPG